MGQNHNRLSQMMERRKTLMLDILFDLIGGVLYASSVYTFAKMANFAPGGVSGLALIINYLFALPIGMTTMVLNIPLIFLSWKVIGKEFLIKTMRSMIVCTFFVDVVFPYTPPYTGDPLLAALYCGLTMGAGLALIYMRGSSTGGTDFLIMSAKVKFPHFSLGSITIIIDMTVILLGWPAFGNVDAVLYGLISTVTCSVVVDKMMYGTNARKLIIIISTQGEQVARAINDRTNRGSTYIQAMGTYSKEKKDVILCACNKAQCYVVTSMIHDIDGGAFVMVTETSEVFGEGFIERSLNQKSNSNSKL